MWGPTGAACRAARWGGGGNPSRSGGCPRIGPQCPPLGDRCRRIVAIEGISSGVFGPSCVSYGCQGPEVREEGSEGALFGGTPAPPHKASACLRAHKTGRCRGPAGTLTDQL